MSKIDKAVTTIFAVGIVAVVCWGIAWMSETHENCNAAGGVLVVTLFPGISCVSEIYP